jgi:multiple sugar transport system ATP-binding protein
MVHFDIDAKAAMTDDVRELAQDTDAVAVSEATKEKAHTTMTGRFGARSRVREGTEAEVAVDTRSLHFFDPQTGLGIYDQTTVKKGDSA